MAARTAEKEERGDLDEEDSEADAEGEVEEDSEADAEGEDDDEDNAGEVVGAVKTRSLRRDSRRKFEEVEEESDAAVDDDGDSNSDSSGSADEEKDWEAADEEGGDGVEVKNADGNTCVFCGQDELNDPGEDFEEYLACAVCGDNAHRSCARDHSALASDEDATHWRCRDCVANGLEEDFKHVPETLASRRGSSAPKMARDLLPAARGGIDPTSHSVFNTLILDEDPMDGSRSLRKRKTPSDDADDLPRPAIRKRRRTNQEENEDEDGVANSDEAVVSGFDGIEDPNSPRSRSGRPQRLKSRRKGARIASRSDDPKSCVVAFSVSIAQWDEIEKQVQKKQRRRERDRIRRARNARARTGTVEVEESQHFPAVQTTMYSNPFYAFPDRDTDENKGRPYGGILTEAEADTAKTYPQDVDRKAFQDAREKAEQKWKDKMAKTSGDTPARGKQTGLPSKIKCINFGVYEIDTWHAAPYPEEYSRNKHLYICEFCLKYMSSDYVAWRHKLKCSAKHPPGDEIYRNDITNSETGVQTTLSFWEVDGRRNPLYCQNLCLLAKLFLGSKTLYYDVEPFLFYIMTENDEFGCHFVGYFSKEKRGSGPPLTPESAHEDSQELQASSGADRETQFSDLSPALTSPGNNVSCILVLPVHMRRGFGRVLIEFSYLLTKTEKRTGSPEKPLSDMGLVSYRSYWRTVLCRLLLRYKDSKEESKETSIADIARDTGMTFDDIISTLEALRFLVRDPVTKTYAVRLDYDYMKEYVEKHDKKATIQLDPKRLVWVPYEMHKSTTWGEESTANQPMQTVAPRTEGIEMPEQPEAGVPQVVKGTEENGGGNDEAATDSIEDATEDRRSSHPNTAMLGAEAFSPRRTSPRKTPVPANKIVGTQTSPAHRTSPRKTPNPDSKTIDTQPSPHQRTSPRKTLNGTTLTLNLTLTRTASNTPSADGSYDGSTSQPTSGGSIPPTRFEIFPPIPGQQSAAKRRFGRPMRGGRKNYGSPYRMTPVRRSNARRTASGTQVTPSNDKGASAMRRTRSKLGEVSLAADGEGEGDMREEENEIAVEDEEGDEDAEGEIEEGADDADAVGEDDDEIRYD